MPGDDYDYSSEETEDNKTINTIELHASSSAFASCSVDLYINPNSIISGNWLIYCYDDCSIVADGLDKVKFSDDSLFNATSYLSAVNGTSEKADMGLVIEHLEAGEIFISAAEGSI